MRQGCRNRPRISRPGCVKYSCCPRVADDGKLLGSRCACTQAIKEVIADPKCVRNDCERGIDGGARREEAAIDDIEVVELVRLAITIKRGGGGIVAKTDGAVLMG